MLGGIYWEHFSSKYLKIRSKRFFYYFKITAASRVGEKREHVDNSSFGKAFNHFLFYFMLPQCVFLFLQK